MTTSSYASDERDVWSESTRAQTTGPFEASPPDLPARQADSLRVLLGILLWEMAYVPLADKAAVLGMDAERLLETMHSDEPIAEDMRVRWSAVAEILRNLSGVLRPEGTPQWLGTTIPGLGGRTPLQEFASDGLGRLTEHTRGYRDPSFG